MNNIINNIDKNIDNLSTIILTKYKFKKYKGKVTITSKPNITPVKLTKQNINEIKNKKLGDKLFKFKKRLYKKINNKNLNLLNNNISSLKIKIKYLAPTFSLKVTAGKYIIKKNKISILIPKNDVINHEFLHMATAFYNKNFKIGFCGFQQILFYKKESCGRGLNEGYTELISRRYFNQNIDRSIDGYKVCMFFTEKLEEIVEKDRMETFYFNADLMGLYKYLCNFDDPSNIATFITILDNIINKKSLQHIKTDPECQLLSCYLSKWFINLKQYELSKNIINKATFDKEIYDYLYSLGTQELYLENYEKQKEYCLK